MTHQLLRSPSLKVARAYTHIKQISAEIASFAQTKPYTIVYEPDPANGQMVARAKLNGRLPDIVDLSVGEALSNLRSALDQLACALAEHNGYTDLKGVYFPINKSEKDFLSSESQKKIKKLSEKSQNIIRELRPYPEGNHPLWVLNELCNIDKHRKLVAIGSRMRNLKITGGVFTDGLNLGSGPVWSTFDEGVELYRVGMSDGLTSHGKIEVDVDISFGDIEAIAHVPVLDVLYRLATNVHQIISRFETEVFTDGADAIDEAKSGISNRNHHSGSSSQ